MSGSTRHLKRASAGIRQDGFRPGSFRQSGFSLVMVIFLIVVLAALGVFTVRVALSQYETTNLELLEARAQAAAESGIQYGSYELKGGGACFSPVSFGFPATAAALSGYVVTVTCSNASSHPIGVNPPWWAYTLQSTAVHGTYGTPDYVSRTVTQTFTNANPP